jgi:hypothetical protein
MKPNAAPNRLPPLQRPAIRLSAHAAASGWLLWSTGGATLVLYLLLFGAQP